MATLSFKGKTFVQNYHLSVKYHQLIPDKEKSLTDKISLNDNLIIHGDNLKALKALLPNYAGKVKCIYIDPPYNTGNENWVYNDNVSSPIMQEWLGKVVDREDLTRHDKWLCMMMPRLKLLKELLSEDGVIFISIDDNEVHHLRMLMDEIFGEQNFLASFIWKKRIPANDSKKLVSTDHDYIICFSKNITTKLIGKEKELKNYTNPDNDPRGPWAISVLVCSKSKEERPNLFYPIIDPETGIKYDCDSNLVWTYERNKMKRLIEEGKVIFPKGGKGKPMYKRHLAELRSLYQPISTWIEASSKQQKEINEMEDESKMLILQSELNAKGTREITEIFGKEIFSYPKPTQIIRELLRVSTENDDIILDSFAGSGTTAHAVLDLNKEDGGNRKFILIECEDYADNITAERVRRVIKGVPNAKDDDLKNGFGGTFSFFELGEVLDIESLLKGENMPSYNELARYVFYTATGEEFDITKVDEESNSIGESKDYEVYLFYKPDIEYLKTIALTLERAKNLRPRKGKKRLVFAPMKYLDQDYLTEYQIEFCQLPFEIYRSRM